MKSSQPGNDMHGYLIRLFSNSLISGLLAVVIIFSGPIQAEEKRQHGTHVHGVAHLNLALENNDLHIEFTSPAADIVGFEHEPETEEEKSAMQKALGRLRAGKRMFKLSPDAGVQLEKSVVKTGLHHDCEHEDHDHGQDSHEQHSDVYIEYRFHVKVPDKLKSIDVMLFKYFKSLQKIEVQVFTQAKQTAVELTPENTKILF
jgi:hypothetical protein